MDESSLGRNPCSPLLSSEALSKLRSPSMSQFPHQPGEGGSTHMTMQDKQVPRSQQTQVPLPSPVPSKRADTRHSHAVPRTLSHGNFTATLQGDLTPALHSWKRSQPGPVTAG